MKFGFRGLFGGCGDKNKERVRAPFAGAKIRHEKPKCKSMAKIFVKVWPVVFIKRNRIFSCFYGAGC